MRTRPIEAVLLDVGQPLVEDSALYEHWNRRVAEYLSNRLDRVITLGDILKRQDDAIRCYAPSIFSYVIWHYVKPDTDLFLKIRYRLDTLDYSKFLFVRPEAAEICRLLSGKYTLAIAANQPRVTGEILDKAGVLDHFAFKRVSAEMQYSKPDLRFFMCILDHLKVDPAHAVMVGDRQDNDIVPAKLLGMRALRWRDGLFKDQEIRLPIEEPDGELTSLHELPGLLRDLESD